MTGAPRAYELDYPNFEKDPPVAGIDQSYKVADTIVNEMAAKTREKGYRAYAEGLVAASVNDGKTGVHLNIFTGGQDVSQELAIVHFNPMGIPLNRTRVMSEVMRLMGVEAGMRDRHGLPPAVFNFSASTGKAGAHLSRGDRAKVLHGDLEPMVTPELNMLRDLVPDLAVVAFAGVSRGGALGAAGARVARDYDLGVQSVVTGMPGNAGPQSPKRLLGVFGQEIQEGDTYLTRKPEIWRDNEVNPGPAYWFGMVRQMGLNLTTLGGLAAGWYGRDLVMAHRQNPDMRSLTMYGVHDLITKGMEHTAYAIHQRVSPDVARIFGVMARHAVCHDSRIIGALLHDGFRDGVEASQTKDRTAASVSRLPTDASLALARAA